ncbi:MAG: hypothetical protein HWN65_10710 [Candidatus Helarchaeota archaeon]|nr:hypothetical protein [Candidatus Helarchaeota archaeon]
MGEERNQRRNFLILTQFVAYGTFLASHFLTWGIWATTHAIPTSYYYYSGIELVSGQISLLLVNSLFIMGIILIILFFFKLQENKNKFFAISFDTIIISYTSAFLISVFGFFFFDNYAKLGINLERLLLGFYLWVVSSSVMVVLLFHVKRIISDDGEGT